MDQQRMNNLRLIAKAAKVELHFCTGGGFPPSSWIRGPGFPDRYWDPYKHREDAVWLARRLGIEFTTHGDVLAQAIALGETKPIGVVQ